MVQTLTMGNAGQKSRKGKKRQHIAKVGTHTNDQAAERRAVADNLGLGHAAPWVRVLAMVVAVLLIAGALIGLLSVVFW